MKENNKLEKILWNIFSFFCSLWILIFLVIDYTFQLPSYFKSYIYLMDKIFCFIFLIEFLVRLYLSNNKLKFLKWGWIDLLAAIPLQEFAWSKFARIFALIRFLNIVKRMTYFSIIIKNKYDLKQKIFKNTFSILIIGLFSIIFFASFFILFFESSLNHSNIKTSEQALWWVLVTISTVGYGDFYPVTWEGRGLAIFLMIVGIGSFNMINIYLLNLIFHFLNENHNDLEKQLIAEVQGLRKEIKEIKEIKPKK